MSGTADQILLLSPAQARLWRLGGGEPSRIFVTAGTVDISGPLDRARLVAALEAVVAARDALRAKIVMQPGLTMPRQMIAAAPNIVWDTSADDSTGDVADRDPLVPGVVYATLTRMAPEQHRLRLSWHAINGDAASVRVVVDEMARVYAGEPEPEEAPASYAAFAAWRQEQVDGEEGEQGASWWRRQALPPPAIAWPDGSARRPSNDGPTVTRLTRRFGDGWWNPEKLADGLSASAFLRAAVAATVGRASGAPTLLLGEVMDGRKYAELEGCVGLLEATVPLGIIVDRRRPFHAWAQELDGLAREAYEWQESVVLDRLLPGGGCGLGFSYLDAPERRAGELSWHMVGLEGASDLFDFGIRAYALPNGLAVDAAFDPRRISDGDAARLLEAIETLAADAFLRPDAPVAALTALPAAERRHVVTAFNAMERRAWEPRLVPLAFDEAARRWPERIAVVEGERTWIFDLLRQRVDVLAARLRDRGAEAERPIAVMLDHSVELAIGLLAVLRAGRAYLPIDPDLPADRIAWLLRDARPALVITSAALRSRLPDDVPCLMCDEAGDAPTELPLPDVSADDLAYVIYTSGSTGHPKGVMITHGGLASYLRWAEETYLAGDGGGAPLHSPIGFDLTVTSLFAPLLRGERVTVVRRAHGSSLGPLAETLEAGAAFSFIKLTPAHARALAGQLGPDRLPGAAKLLVIGGESLSGTDVAAWRQHAPTVRIVNEYGPTEAVVGCITYEVSDDTAGDGAIPIGRPISGMRAYVLDAAGEPVGIGVVGELFVAGPQLARGYLGRPDLAAERFVPDPFSGQMGSRLYRTGDLARWREDGVLAYHGRADRQVKILGHRVEPAEVERVLHEAGGLRDVAVVARLDPVGQLRLVAYLVPEGSGREVALLDLDGLRRRVEAELPSWMVPAAYVSLSGLPLTHNGKVDRAALPEPLWTGGGAAYVAPRTADEEILAGIWGQVLGVARVGIEDGYFALGGNSIRALQVVARAQERGLPLTLDLLFAHQTVRELAAAIGAMERPAADPPHEPFSLIAPEARARLAPDIVDAYPLARLQAGMIFHRELRPDLAVYHDVCGYDIAAPWSEAMLRTALRGLMARHEALRTSFAMSGFAEPMQMVHHDVPVPLVVEDLRGVDEEEQERVLRAFMEEEKARDFDVSTPPLLRFIVHRRTDETFRFWISFHHAVLDGWSDVSLLVELAQVYRALLRGHPVSIRTPAARYRDFIALERAALGSPEVRSFWTDEVRDLVSPRLPIPSTVTAQRVRGTRVELRPIDSDVVEGLKSLAQRLALPLKSVLLAAHLKALSLLGDGRDAATLMTMVGRPETADGDRVAGLHLNSVPVRLRFAAGDAFADVAVAAFAAERRLMPFRRFPLAEIQRIAAPGSLPEVSFYFTHYYNVRDLDGLPDLRVLGATFYEETNFPLVVHFSLRPETGRLNVGLHYDPSRLGVEAVQALAATIEAVLTAMATDATAAHSTVSRLQTPSVARRPLTDAERRRWLVEANDTGRDWPFEPIGDWFARVAATHAGARAIEDAGAGWSYAALAARADALANALRDQGVGPESVVGILMEHSGSLVATLLGVLRAGAAYLPLDPTLPPERLAFLIADAGVGLVLTQPALADLVGTLDGAAPVWTLDEHAWPAGGAPNAPLRRHTLQPDSLAYVIYTSGSTGRPKGVMVTHGGLANYLHAAIEEYGNGAPIDALLHSSIGFDLTVTSMFPPLLTGGRVYLAGSGGQGLMPLLETMRSGVNVGLLKATPAHVRLLADELGSEGLAAAARTAVIGGEALFTDDIAPWTAAGIRVVNEYGPTETVVGCVTHAVTGPLPAGETVPIGRPLANTRVYVLDAAGEPVASGVVGELHVGGAGVARGYLGRPDLTAERFVPDVYSGAVGARLYRAGDLVRWRESGDLEYVGRADDQVKVRGYRIELGEIEHVLRESTLVRDAAVMLRADERGEEPRIVAYVVLDGPAGAASHQPLAILTAWMAERLPAWMVPAAYVSLERLPLTANGKVDRGVLPPPQARASVAGFVDPATPEEETLAAIWSDVLGVERVGATDDYFALGGDSIRSLQVVARARERGLDLTLEQLLRHRSIRELAAALREAEPALDATVPTLTLSPDDASRLPAGVVDAYPLARLQAGMIFHRELRPQSAVYHVVCGYDVHVAWDEDKLRGAVAALVARHPVLRTSFDLAGFSEPLQLVHATLPAPLVVEDLRTVVPAAQEEILAAFLDAEAQRDFDLGVPPLVRFVAHRTADDRMTLWVSSHHAILDGWSHVSMLVELATAYTRLLAGGDAEASPLAVSFRDFVAAERAAIASDAVRTFWQTRLDGCVDTRLARWRFDDETERGAGAARHPVPLDVNELGVALQRLARQMGLPLKSLLLAAHVKLMAAWSGTDEVVTAVTSNGRLEREDGVRALGLHLNTVPLRLRLGSASWRELASAVFDADRALHPYRRFPLAEIQRVATGGRSIAETNFLFTHYHNARSVGDLGVGLRGLRIHGETNFAFDLHVALRPHDGQLTAQIVYDRAQFPPAQIDAMAAYLVRVLEAMTADAAASHACVPDVLTAAAGVAPEPTRHGFRAPAFADSPYVGPRDETERVLCEIWAGMLGVPRVGVEHDFFALGGDSLLAMQAVVRTRARLHTELPLSALFEAPTVAELARRVAGERPSTSPPPITRVARTRQPV